MKGLFCLLERNQLKQPHIIDRNIFLKYKVDLNEIIFVQTNLEQKNVLNIYVEDEKTYTYRCSLRSIINLSEKFIFISKSTIINVEMIRKTNSSYSAVYLGVSERRIKVSRKFIKPLQIKLKKHYLI